MQIEASGPRQKAHKAQMCLALRVRVLNGAACHLSSSELLTGLPKKPEAKLKYEDLRGQEPTLEVSWSLQETKAVSIAIGWLYPSGLCCFWP